jgi:hypothetical protein
MRYIRDHTLNQTSNNAELGKYSNNFNDKTPTYELTFSIAGTYEILFNHFLYYCSHNQSAKNEIICCVAQLITANKFS